ncbi:hypothetical protein CEXT_101551 [Caerostris extrusa]|uniref:Uncharacterized protein n=1 Tax=Caerostris extrusa TaxID=172846 RepID=A0AAV4WKP7_CAEEX|nr:hypothetical protein CEXT_101551 [Caerostris extrusa]
MRTAYDKASKPKHFNFNVKLPLVKKVKKHRKEVRRTWQRTKHRNTKNTNMPPLRNERRQHSCRSTCAGHSVSDEAEAIADCWKLQFEGDPNISHPFSNNPNNVRN